MLKKLSFILAFLLFSGAANATYFGQDPNNAPYSTATVMTTGTTYSASRGFQATCTVGGNITLTLAGSGSLVYAVVVGTQTQPFSVTSVSATTATCTDYALN